MCDALVSQHLSLHKCCITMTGILRAFMQFWMRRRRRRAASAAPEWQETLLKLYVRDPVDPTAAALTSSRKSGPKCSSGSLRVTGVTTWIRPDAANVTARSDLYKVGRAAYLHVFCCVPAWSCFDVSMPSQAVWRPLLVHASDPGAQLGALDVLILLCMQLQGSWAVAGYKRGFSTCQVCEHGRAGLLGQALPATHAIHRSLVC